MKIISMLATASAFSGSIWAWHREKCSKCQSPPLLFGIKLPLAQAGMGYYPAILYGIAKEKQWAATGLTFAAFIHAALISYMLVTKQVCPACMLTGISSFVAAATVEPATTELTLI